ncbi:hypothetical protein mRhiFer1_008614 [Rhinolophus ferrumequinum]|uniref:Uncharacterized protein n=1 Tax=Rhinolophus ferrumequinum TaxID=59479 RepID=A0A7J7U0W1_RHIFE|nr:hypothetical protein mRhiFer1_008614 [Rhinolophus ferrumequinum]
MEICPLASFPPGSCPSLHGCPSLRMWAASDLLYCKNEKHFLRLTSGTFCESPASLLSLPLLPPGSVQYSHPQWGPLPWYSSLQPLGLHPNLIFMADLMLKHNETANLVCLNFHQGSCVLSPMSGVRQSRARPHVGASDRAATAGPITLVCSPGPHPCPFIR